MVGSMTVLGENTFPLALIPRFPNKPTHPAASGFHPKHLAHLPGEGSGSALENVPRGCPALLLGPCGGPQCHPSSPLTQAAGFAVTKAAQAEVCSFSTGTKGIQ